MHELLGDYSTGDLVIFLQAIEWNGMAALEGEIGIVIEILSHEEEGMVFDFKVQLPSGGFIPVWRSEINRLEDASDI